MTVLLVLAIIYCVVMYIAQAITLLVLVIDVSEQNDSPHGKARAREQGLRALAVMRWLPLAPVAYPIILRHYLYGKVWPTP